MVLVEMDLNQGGGDIERTRFKSLNRIRDGAGVQPSHVCQGGVRSKNDHLAAAAHRGLRVFWRMREDRGPGQPQAAVIRNAFGIGGGTALNRSYRELARHYGFKIDPTPPYSPEKKGKVEASVKYVKFNGLKVRDGECVEEVNRALFLWVEEIAGRRVHGTTGKAPLTVFQEEEAGFLLPFPAQPFEPLPNAASVPTGMLEHPAHARNLRELLDEFAEVDHEPHG